MLLSNPSLNFRPPVRLLQARSGLTMPSTYKSVSLMNVSTKSLSRACLGLALVLFLSACDSRASRAQAAFYKYQAASNAGNLADARRALLELVAANEDVDEKTYDRIPTVVGAPERVSRMGDGEAHPPGTLRTPGDQIRLAAGPRDPRLGRLAVER